MLHTPALRHPVLAATLPAATELRDHLGHAPTSRRRLRMWLALSVAVVLVGSGSAFLAATTAASAHAKASRTQFASSSAQIISTLELAIEKEQDLALDASGFVVGSPTASNAAFGQWANSVQALDRHPEVLGLGQVVIVPADQLASFATRAASDPAGPMPTDGVFQVVPPGVRTQYCLLANAQSRSAASAFPAGYDYCTGPLGAAGLSARDSGQGAYFPIEQGNSTALVIMTPIYQGGVLPATVTERQAAFLGWVGMSIVPQVLLQRALNGHEGMAVHMQYRANFSDASFESGTISAGARSITTNLNNGWTLTTYNTVASGDVFSNTEALALLLAGVIASLLLGALLVVLATTRIRALTLVSARTDQLRHQALHDALTDLPNRVLILDRITQLLARNDRNGTMGAALFIDLDGFKNVNDTLGHATGDQLLQAVAARLTATLRDADTIGRMGGDEFVVLIDGATLHIAPEMVAERLLEVMRQPFVLEGAPTPIMITASVGIAAGHADTPEDLLREADIALYQAKTAGRNCYEIFGTQMGNDILQRYELEFELRHALDDNQYRLLYQPIYNLSDLTLVGAEALLRWEHPTLGQVGPDQFIPLLESSGQIVEVGRWVLNEACAQAARWHALGHRLNMSVNVSGRQLDRDSIIEHVADALTTSGLDPASLTIEITETALMRNIEATSRRLVALKELGVKLAIDDFGTGYSSIAYLQGFPVDSLKIDKTFTDTISRSQESDALIRTLIQLGADLGLKTVAEGVENQHQVDYLRNENVTEVQGFLFAKPLTSEALGLELLHDDLRRHTQLHESVIS